MSNRKISAKLGKTYNIGNYESIRLDVAVETDLTSDTKINDAVNALFCQCEEWLWAYEQRFSKEINRGRPENEEV